MPIQKPSQYQCNNMQPGDLVYVKKRNWLYKLYRELSSKEKTKLKVRADWKEPIKYNIYYQEDCTLIYSYELQAMKDYNDEVPCRIALSEGSNLFKVYKLKKVHIDLYNISLIFNNGITLTFPLSYIDAAIKHNEQAIKNVEDERLINERLKFLRHKGEEFKQIVKDRNIKIWHPAYCSMCGKSIDFKFNTKGVTMKNNCNCGCLSVNLDHMTYDQFAIWYANQINPSVEKIYNKFWFAKE